jgi:hypothetical protein
MRIDRDGRGGLRSTTRALKTNPRRRMQMPTTPRSPSSPAPAGIGSAAQALLRHGYRVVLAGRRLDPLEQAIAGAAAAPGQRWR